LPQVVSHDRVGTVCCERWGERPVAFVVPAGKFSKKDLREEFADESLVEGQAPDARE
jgi:acyl-CoA synthetase (AMP-forming)/AMP-acid ligase II